MSTQPVSGHGMSWRLCWAAACVPAVALLYLSTRGLYFKVPFNLNPLYEPAVFDSIYKPSWWKAQFAYFASITLAYIALYAFVSLIKHRLSGVEAKIQIAFWTLWPPLWFAFERYFFIGTNDEGVIKKLVEGQEYSAKIWGALVALMLAFQLGESVKTSMANAAAEARAAFDAATARASRTPVGSDDTR